jgi:hypothetical protein
MTLFIQLFVATSVVCNCSVVAGLFEAPYARLILKISFLADRSDFRINYYFWHPFEV